MRSPPSLQAGLPLRFKSVQQAGVAGRCLRWLALPGGREIVVGAIVMVLLLTVCVAAPLLAHDDPLTTNANALYLKPGAPGHPLGTDSIGRDLLSRTLYGGRISLTVGLLAAGMSLVLGVLAGTVAGMSPPWLDTALMRTIDALLTLPLLVVIIAVQAIARPSLTSVVLVIGLTSWMPMARVVRAEFLSLRERDFVRAAVSLGTSRRTIALRHILPNALPPVLVVAAFQVSHAVMTESTLSFLGLGVPPHMPTWGNMLTAAEQHLITGEWWTLLWPGMGIVLSVLSVNLAADGIRKRSDPRTRRSA